MRRAAPPSLARSSSSPGGVIASRTGRVSAHPIWRSQSSPIRKIEEDLEQEALWQEEEHEDEGEFSVEEDEEEDLADVDDLKEAYASGWRAKQKSADQRKARGYHSSKGSSSSKGKGKGDRRSTDERKKKSQCASCKQYGHWHGDAECPNVKNGKDPPRQSQPMVGISWRPMTRQVKKRRSRSLRMYSPSQQDLSRPRRRRQRSSRSTGWLSRRCWRTKRLSSASGRRSTSPPVKRRSGYRRSRSRPRSMPQRPGPWSWTSVPRSCYKCCRTCRR